MTVKHVAKAMNFLTDEWLGDVLAKTHADKCGPIVAALSIIERTLFDVSPIVTPENRDILGHFRRSP